MVCGKRRSKGRKGIIKILQKKLQERSPREEIGRRMRPSMNLARTGDQDPPEGRRRSPKVRPSGGQSRTTQDGVREAQRPEQVRHVASNGKDCVSTRDV